MKDSLILNVEETLQDWKCLLPRWNKVKDSPELRKKFCNRNRNPLFDISNNSFFDTGLGSFDGLNSNTFVKDHFIQRTKAVGLIFEELNQNPDIGVNQFIKLLRKYCSVVRITKVEHSKVTSYCKTNKEAYNYEAYRACGIKISGLSELILQN